MPEQGSARDGDKELLIAADVFDEVYYRQAAAIGGDQDAATHYLTIGWRQGLAPRPEFDPAFLTPYYAAAGRSGPPALIWVALSMLPGRVPPRNATEASWQIERLAHTPHFDAPSYAARLPPGLDPLLHYIVIGELLGWSPSSRFDPGFYLDRHRDVARLRLSPLDHYVENGAREGRQAVPAISRLMIAARPAPERRAILLLVHQASRTGAPILGWNIARGLGRVADVVTVMMLGGALEAALREVSAAAIGPLQLADWHEAEFERLAAALVEAYDPVFAIANSVETAALVPALGRRGVPVVALVHEFAAYVRPLSKLADALSWSTHVVFPAEVVATAARRAFPALSRRRGVHILAQGRPMLPGKERLPPRPAPGCAARPDGSPFTVLGLGTVNMRKGVDLFIAAAASAVRSAPAVRFRFVWFGDGYDPEADTSYSVYLAAQVVQSGLDGVVEIRGEVDDLDPAYEEADAFLLASRLDPQPNVAIEAIVRGLPTVCFDGASGTADILAADPATRMLVVPHLDSHAAGEVLARLALSPVLRSQLAAAVARAGAAAYDMDGYIGQLARMGHDAALRLDRNRLAELAATGAVDPGLALPPGTPVADLLQAERQVLQQWPVVGMDVDQTYNGQFRRPCPGFHPQAYAAAHPIAAGDHPLLHWIRAGRPAGPWSHPVHTADPGAPQPASRVRPVVHAVLTRPESLVLLSQALAVNQSTCDLVVSVTSGVAAHDARRRLTGRRSGTCVHVTSQPVPLLVLLHEIVPWLAGPPDQVVLHLHDVLDDDLAAGDAVSQQAFLWETLVGPDAPMLDLAAGVLERQQGVGLVMAEHPRLDGWCGYRDIAEALADGLTPRPVLPEFFDHPRGGMFMTRLPVLQEACSLVGRVPQEVDLRGVAAAAVRLLPQVAASRGLSVVALRVPGTTC